MKDQKLTKGFEKPMKYRLVYLNDPLCGWCYAMKPAVEFAMSELNRSVVWDSVVGGLFVAQEAKLMKEEMRSHLETGIPEVEKLSSVRFGSAFWANIVRNDTFVYETGSACKAMVAIAALDCTKAIEFMHRLQEAFFDRGEDANSISLFNEIATKQLGLDSRTFVGAYFAQSTRTALEQQFSLATNLLSAFGADTFPTFILETIDAPSRQVKIDHEKDRSPAGFVAAIQNAVAELS